MEQTLVTLIIFNDIQKAHILQAELESAGITSYIADELATQMYGSSYAVGGVRVQVNEKDLERAKTSLKDLGYE